MSLQGTQLNTIHAGLRVTNQEELMSAFFGMRPETGRYTVENSDVDFSLSDFHRIEVSENPDSSVWMFDDKKIAYWDGSSVFFYNKASHYSCAHNAIMEYCVSSGLAGESIHEAYGGDCFYFCPAENEPYFVYDTRAKKMDIRFGIIAYVIDILDGIIKSPLTEYDFGRIFDISRYFHKADISAPADLESLTQKTLTQKALKTKSMNVLQRVRKILANMGMQEPEALTKKYKRMRVKAAMDSACA